MTREAKRQRDALYRATHRELLAAKQLERSRRWTPEELARTRAREAKWRAQHADHVKEYQRRHRETQAEQYAAYHAEYYKANRAKLRAKQREYNAQHRKERDARAAKWMAENREHSLQYQRAYAARHREKKAAIARQWAKDHPLQKQTQSRNQKALRRGAPGRHTAADILRMFETQRGLCAACAVPLAKSGPKKYHVDHIMPLSRGGSNDPSNLQLLCRSCNMHKSDMDPVEWASYAACLTFRL